MNSSGLLPLVLATPESWLLLFLAGKLLLIISYKQLQIECLLLDQNSWMEMKIGTFSFPFKNQSPSISVDPNKKKAHRLYYKYIAWRWLMTIWTDMTFIALLVTGYVVLCQGGIQGEGKIFTYIATIYIILTYTRMLIADLGPSPCGPQFVSPWIKIHTNWTF